MDATVAVLLLRNVPVGRFRLWKAYIFGGQSAIWDVEGAAGEGSIDNIHGDFFVANLASQAVSARVGMMLVLAILHPHALLLQTSRRAVAGGAAAAAMSAAAEAAVPPVASGRSPAVVMAADRSVVVDDPRACMGNPNQP